MARFSMGKLVTDKKFSPEEKYQADGKYIYKQKISCCVMAVFCFFLAIVVLAFAVFMATENGLQSESFRWTVFSVLAVFALFWTGCGIVLLCYLRFYGRLCDLLLKGESERVEPTDVNCVQLKISKEYRSRRNCFLIIYAEQNGEESCFYYVIQRDTMARAPEWMLRETLKGKWSGFVYKNSPFLYRIDVEEQIAELAEEIER